MNDQQGHYKRPMPVRLAIERAKVSVHAPGQLRGYDRAASLALGHCAWQSPAGHLIDALSEHVTLMPEDEYASRALNVLRGHAGLAYRDDFAERTDDNMVTDR